MTCQRFKGGIVCSLTERIIPVRVAGRLYEFEIAAWGGAWINQDGSGRRSPVPRAARDLLEKILETDK